jgi:hypothetical protein
MKTPPNMEQDCKAVQPANERDIQMEYSFD